MSRQTGEMWVRRPTETLQYHTDGETKTVFPEPYATVLDENIEDGDLVSIVWDAGEGKSGVVRTDNTITKRAYGFARLAQRDPELGPHSTLVKGETQIEIQTYGEFELPFSHFTQDPVPDDIGLGVLAVSPQEYEYRREGDATAQPGKVTVSRFEATTYGGSVIEAGTVSNIDVTNEIATIKVVIGGDSRGPVGLTEVEYVTNQLIPTNNTPRVYAYVNNEESKNHKEVFEWHIGDDIAPTLGSRLKDSWFALDMLFAHPAAGVDGRDDRQKKTLVVYFIEAGDDTAALTTDILNNGLTDSASGSTRNTIPSINGGGRFQVKNSDSIAFVEVPDDRPQLFNNMISAVEDTMLQLFDVDGTYDPRLKITITDDVLSQGNTISTGNNGTLTDNEDYTLIFETINSTMSGATQGGVVYAYRAPWIKDNVEFRHYISKYGEIPTDDDFRVVPADRRKHVDGYSSDAPKLVNLAGVLSTPIPTTTDSYVHRGANVMMQKMGTIGGFTNLKSGKKVYLGLNGHVTQAAHEIKFDEYMVEIGVARSETEIDVRLSDPRLKSTTRDSMPVGVIVPRAYDLSQNPPVPADPPPGFLALEGQTLAAEEYPDLYMAYTGEMPSESSPDLTLQDDPSHVIKAYSFSLYPDTATPEIPVQSRRFETSWKVIDGDNLGNGNSDLYIPHRLKTSIRDIIGYAVISVTDSTEAPGYESRPLEDAPQIIVYPGYGSDSGSFFGYQFEEDSMDSILARVGNTGLKIAHDGTMLDVTASQASNILADAENFVVKFVIYKIENIYDFKDDRLIEKANEFWYDHRRRYYWDDDVEVHGVRATTIPDDGTLIRRDSDSRAQVDFPFQYTGSDGYTDAAITSIAAASDITNKDYVDNMDQANRNWTDGHLQTHKDTEDEGIHGSSVSADPYKLIHRDNDGRSKVTFPYNFVEVDGYPDAGVESSAADLDITNKLYVVSVDEANRTWTSSTIQTLIDDTIDPHIADTSETVHGSSVAPTADRLMHRDADGRSQANEPAAGKDVANKIYVDALRTYVEDDLEDDKVDPHIANTSEGLHGSSVSATDNTLMHRDGSGRSQVSDPSDDADVANKGWVQSGSSAVVLANSSITGANGEIWIE